jgi:hypothetical protein
VKRRFSANDPAGGPRQRSHAGCRRGYRATPSGEKGTVSTMVRAVTEIGRTLFLLGDDEHAACCLWWPRSAPMRNNWWG